MPATTAEILQAYQSLSAQDLRALHVYANRHLSAPYSEPMDLIHEALCRSLDGRRNWPMEIPFVIYMVQTMKSIVGHDRERIENQASRNESVGTEWEDSRPEGAYPSAEDQAIVFEQIELARKAAAKAKAQLAGDDAAQNVIDGIMAGLSPRETCEHYGLGAKTYDAARHRVMRRLRAGALH